MSFPPSFPPLDFQSLLDDSVLEPPDGSILIRREGEAPGAAFTPRCLQRWNKQRLAGLLNPQQLADYLTLARRRRISWEPCPEAEPQPDPQRAAGADKGTSADSTLRNVEAILNEIVRIVDIAPKAGDGERKSAPGLNSSSSEAGAAAASSSSTQPQPPPSVGAAAASVSAQSLLHSSLVFVQCIGRRFSILHFRTEAAAVQMADLMHRAQPASWRTFRLLPGRETAVTAVPPLTIDPVVMQRLNAAQERQTAVNKANSDSSDRDSVSASAPSSKAPVDQTAPAAAATSTPAALAPAMSYLAAPSGSILFSAASDRFTSVQPRSTSTTRFSQRHYAERVIFSSSLFERHEFLDCQLNAPSSAIAHAEALVDELVRTGAMMLSERSCITFLKRMSSSSFFIHMSEGAQELMARRSPADIRVESWQQLLDAEAERSHASDKTPTPARSTHHPSEERRGSSRSPNRKQGYYRPRSRSRSRNRDRQRGISPESHRSRNDRNSGQERDWNHERKEREREHEQDRERQRRAEEDRQQQDRELRMERERQRERAELEKLQHEERERVARQREIERSEQSRQLKEQMEERDCWRMEREHQRDEYERAERSGAQFWHNSYPSNSAFFSHAAPPPPSPPSFNVPLDLALVFSSNATTVSDGVIVQTPVGAYTSDPKILSKRLVLSGIPEETNGRSERKSERRVRKDLESAVQWLQKAHMQPRHVEWIARASNGEGSHHATSPPLLFLQCRSSHIPSFCANVEFCGRAEGRPEISMRPCMEPSEDAAAAAAAANVSQPRASSPGPSRDGYSSATTSAADTPRFEPSTRPPVPTHAQAAAAFSSPSSRDDFPSNREMMASSTATSFAGTYSSPPAPAPRSRDPVDACNPLGSVLVDWSSPAAASGRDRRLSFTVVEHPPTRCFSEFELTHLQHDFGAPPLPHLQYALESRGLNSSQLIEDAESWVHYLMRLGILVAEEMPRFVQRIQRHGEHRQLLHFRARAHKEAARKRMEAQ